MSYETLIGDIKLIERIGVFDEVKTPLEIRIREVNQVFETRESLLRIAKSPSDKRKLLADIEKVILDLANCGNVTEAQQKATEYKLLEEQYLPNAA